VAVLVKHNKTKIGLFELPDLFYKAIDPASLTSRETTPGSSAGQVSTSRTPKTRRSYKDPRRPSGRTFQSPVVVETDPLENLFPAEEFRQQYLDKNPGRYCHISLKSFKEAARTQGNASPPFQAGTVRE
jgi:peptide methionine sulfoxide reductase msrA/msrB